MFHNQILELQSQLHYHQQQIEETEQELYQLKAFQSYGDQAFACVQEAISHIDGKYLDAFKEALLSLFDNPTLDDRRATTTITQEEEKEYVEYISDNVCYDPEADIVHIGFKDQQLAEQWAHQLHHIENYGHRYVIEESEHLPDYPIELKIQGVTMEDARTLSRTCDFTKPPIKEKVIPQSTTSGVALGLRPSGVAPARPDFTPVTYTDITADIVYSSEGRCYVGFSSRARASTYGQLLKEVYEFTTAYLVEKPTILHKHKWELKMYCSEDNAHRLALLNLKKELTHPENKVHTDAWVHKELPQSFDKGYPKIELAELELADRITRSPHSQCVYEVIQNHGEYVTVRCLEHNSMSGLVGQEYALTEAYLICRGGEVS